LIAGQHFSEERADMLMASRIRGFGYGGCDWLVEYRLGRLEVLGWSLPFT
jgi:hypothetical protein